MEIFGRKVRGLLNKLTLDKFDRLSQQLLALVHETMQPSDEDKCKVRM